jgi:hypothetical protein
MKLSSFTAVYRPKVETVPALPALWIHRASHAAVRLKPEFLGGKVGLSSMCQKNGDFDGRSELTEVVKAGPDFAEARFNFGPLSLAESPAATGGDRATAPRSSATAGRAKPVFSQTSDYHRLCPAKNATVYRAKRSLSHAALLKRRRASKISVLNHRLAKLS